VTVRILYFARIRESLGVDFEDVEVMEGATVQDVLDDLASRHGVVRTLLPALRTGVNDRYTDRSVRLSDGDEIAILSPVSGG
jgi:MoaD family protein